MIYPTLVQLEAAARRLGDSITVSASQRSAIVALVREAYEAGVDRGVSYVEAHEAPTDDANAFVTADTDRPESP